MAFTSGHSGAQSLTISRLEGDAFAPAHHRDAMLPDRAIDDDGVARFYIGGAESSRGHDLAQARQY